MTTHIFYSKDTKRKNVFFVYIAEMCMKVLMIYWCCATQQRCSSPPHWAPCLCSLGPQPCRCPGFYNSLQCWAACWSSSTSCLNPHAAACRGFPQESAAPEITQWQVKWCWFKELSTKCSFTMFSDTFECQIRAEMIFYMCLLCIYMHYSIVV